MGSTSVTGSGQGSAAGQGGGNKGSEHMSLAVHRLIGPRCVSAGRIILSESGFGTVYLPTLPGTVDQYCIFLSSDDSTFPYWGNFTTSSFEINGGDGATVCWQVVKDGLWGSVTTGLENT